MTPEERIRAHWKMVAKEWLTEGWAKESEINTNPPIPPAELEFIHAVRRAAAADVGYGLMQNIIEWEWQDKSDPPGGAWGPEYFQRRIAELEAKVASLEKGAVDAP